MPYSKRIANNIPEKVTVVLKARGFELLWIGLYQRLKTISVDLAEKNSTGNKIGLGIAGEFNKQFGKEISSIEVVATQPDSVYIFLSSKYQKKVAVRPSLRYSLKKNFGLLENIKMVPDSIFISGEKSVIEKIDSVITQNVEFTALDKSVQKDLNIVTPAKDVLLSAYQSLLTIPVDEFIENKISLAVHFQDGDNKRLVLIPEKVDVIYKAPLKYYNSLPLDSFKISTTRQPGSPEGKLLIKVENYPFRAQVISAIPSSVTYFIQR